MHPSCPENSWTIAAQNHTAPVLLFESKLYRACSTSHVWMSPGDILQHCASARDFVGIGVIWSKETSSPSQIHENHVASHERLRTHSSAANVCTDMPVTENQSSDMCLHAQNARAKTHRKIWSTSRSKVGRAHIFMSR